LTDSRCRAKPTPIARVRLGAASDRVFVCGNLKYDVKPGSSSDTGLEEILTRDHRPLIIAASTLAGEEEIVLSSFLKVRETHALAKTRLLIAPRHPERFRSVEHLLVGTGLSLLRRSELNENGTEPVPDPDIVLLDSMGELSGLFRFGSVVFVGGSLVPRGGHNILEPAAVARPIVVGPHMDNFREITTDFLKRQALVQINGAGVDPSTSLTEALLKILQNADYANELGLNAEAAVRSQVGAVDCLANHVESLLTSMTNR
jgi:3-deoxy-D-manno-octulosonic-acid transferase